MTLGIIINTDRHLADISGIVKAAISKGHEVILFSMDDGTRLIDNPEFTGLCKIKGITISFCTHSARHLDLATEVLPTEIFSGSQYNNAIMVSKADRVIVL